MLNIGPLELMVIFLIALIVVGPRKLPDLGKTIGKGLREFRKAQDEMRQSLQLDELKDVKQEITDTQRGVREALRFETPKTSPSKAPGDAAPGAGATQAPGETPAPQTSSDAEAAPGSSGTSASERPAGESSPPPIAEPDPRAEAE